MQTKHLGDVQGGQPLASLDHRFGQSLGHPGIAIKPADGLYSLAARPTSDTSQLHIQSHRAAKNRQVTDRTLAVFMDGGAGPVAAAAGGKSGALWDEVDQQAIAVRLNGGDRKALPKGQKRINIVHKNAGLLMCLLARTSSIKPAFLFLSFPGFREEP